VSDEQGRFDLKYADAENAAISAVKQIRMESNADRDLWVKTLQSHLDFFKSQLASASSPDERPVSAESTPIQPEIKKASSCIYQFQFSSQLF
jgi:hypothetical protein